MDLTADHAYQVGRFLGWYYGETKRRSGDTTPVRVVIGKDTRRSSYLFEYALVAGLIAGGADAYMLHVTTTPSVCFAAARGEFDCGVMISASHNPFTDNGIKLVNGDGEKIDDRTIQVIEDYLDGGVILSDRYTTSNAVHQGGKLEGAAREEFFSWLYDLEFNRMGLPKPDLVLWLDMPVEIAESLMRKRESDTGTKADIHERDDGYLHKCREVAQQAADYFGWTRVSCVRDGRLRSIEDIHEELYAHVQSCLEEI